ncbi:poly(A) RNA polymerase gld-2 homolog A-like [Anthonomus grandis grandis]|uniref:poly(A) RNA polymerase gld-2 homolog A-like n=1 Tax=Anthonomus grandis grandis TaxID=2921223 RepID=UPI002165BA2F|nr:poly(A) RNA polymerase gld-2 homolog A-like [Anthonomus grandis grandis]
MNIKNNMNGTAFFDSVKSKDQKVSGLKKGEIMDSKMVEKGHFNKSSTIMGMPFNFLPIGCSKSGDDYKEASKGGGVYRPIQDAQEEELTIFEFRNSPSPTEDALKFLQGNYVDLNCQRVFFSSFSEIPSETFTPTHNNSCHQSTNGNFKYPFNNNYRNHNNNNVNNNNYSGHYTKNRYSNNTQSNNPSNNGRQPHRRPLPQYKNTIDFLTNRVNGISNRFKARAEIMKIDPHPPQLLNGGPYDSLSTSLYDVFKVKAQTKKSFENKIQIWKDLFLYIRGCLTNYALYIVGSTMTGFGLDSSDIDMCLLIRPFTEDPRLDALHQLYNIKNSLMKCGFIVNPELILAKVPILKFQVASTGFEVDLNCNNSVGIFNSHLLYCYARCDWRVRPLVIIIKLWAQANNINDAKNLTVSSYSWTLMLIHYLQCGVSPSVLPCLHHLYPDYFNADKNNISDFLEDLDVMGDFQSCNTQSLAELFIGFFGYYSNFDFGQFAISVRAGGRLLIEACKQVKAPKNDPNQWKYLCIEEPFDFTNTARSVYDITAFRHIRDVIMASYAELVRTKLLSSVLPVKMESDCPLLSYEGLDFGSVG